MTRHRGTSGVRTSAETVAAVDQLADIYDAQPAGYRVDLPDGRIVERQCDGSWLGIYDGWRDEVDVVAALRLGVLQPFVDAESLLAVVVRDQCGQEGNDGNERTNDPPPVAPTRRGDGRRRVRRLQ